MTLTEDAIQTIADSLCLLSKPEHRDLYVKALAVIAKMAKDELIFRMELDMDRANRLTH